MTESYPDALRISRTVLRILIVLNKIAGVFIFALLAGTFVAEDWVMKALGAHAGPETPGVLAGMRLIMIIGVLSVPLTHIVLTRLANIVATVADGDAFVAINADRLEKIAWSVLGLEILHLIVGITEARISTTAHPIDLDWSFSVTRWLAVLLCFVLARVFRQGARMRDDLEGTV